MENVILLLFIPGSNLIYIYFNSYEAAALPRVVSYLHYVNQRGFEETRGISDQK